MAQSVGRSPDRWTTARWPDPRRCRAGGRPKRDGSRRRSGTRRRRGAPRFRGGHRSAARCSRAAMRPEGGKAFGHPDALGEMPEQPAVLGAADRELEPDALVAREQREEPVGRGRGDGLDPARYPPAIEAPRRCRHRGREEPAQAGQPSAPELHQRDQMLLAGRGERHPGLVAGHEPLGEEGLHLPTKVGLTS